jgi:hypothetical protein
MTTFEITKLPERCQLKILTNNVVLGVQYPIADEANLKAVNSTGFFGEPFDLFKYKIRKDGISSINEGDVVLNFETNKTGMPLLVNALKEMSTGVSFFLSEFAIPDAHFDKIVIDSITGKGTWSYNGAPLIVGQTFFLYDITNAIVFQANELSIESDYNILTWKTQNKNEIHNQTNTITINTIGSIGTLTDFHFEGRWSVEDTFHNPAVNSWVTYLDEFGVVQTFLVGESELGCQTFSAVSIIDYNGCDPCIPI